MPSRRIHIVGAKNSGKTTLLEFLVGELTARGVRVGTIKHSSHAHPLDRPGSDSDRHRRAGANPTAFVTPEGMALVVNEPDDPFTRDLLERAYVNCDLVLVESLRHSPAPKIALAAPDDPLTGLENVIAVVNSSGTHGEYPAFGPFDKKLVNFILEFLRTGGNSR